MATLPLSQTNAKLAWDTLLNMLQNCQSYSLTFQQQVTANAVDPGNVLGITSWAGQAIAYINTVAANASLKAAVVAYVQQVYNATSLDVATVVGNIKTALQNVINAVNTDFPHNASNQLLYQTFSTVTGLPVVANTTAATWPNTTTAVTAWLANLS